MAATLSFDNKWTQSHRRCVRGEKSFQPIDGTKLTNLSFIFYFFRLFFIFDYWQRATIAIR
jgi:hypothetical protein